MARRTFRVPLPHAGLNTDASLTGLDANESPFLQNAIITEPGQIRPRRGCSVARDYTASLVTSATDVPVGWMSLDDKMLMTYMSQSQHASLQHPHDRFRITDAVDNVTTALTASYALVDRRATSLARIGPASANLIEYNAPYGPTVPYDGSVYGVSLAPQGGPAAFWYLNAMANTIDPVLAPASDAPPDGTRLVRWGGSLQTARVSTQVSLANGSTSGTFTASIPAASMTGMFLVDRLTGNGSTSRDPAFPFSYTYRITQHTAGQAAFSIDRAFGIGATAAQVPSMVTLATVLTPITDIPLSYTQIGHVALHRDRLFVGQLHSTVKVSGIPAGRSVNAIAWSSEGEPNKWSSTNLAAVDDRADEAITGLASAGNGSVLLIFKRDRTFGLFGSSEDNFEIRLISSTYGCIDSHGIVAYDGGVIFPSARGLILYDGVSFRDLTQSRPGHGVRSTYLESINGRQDPAGTGNRRRRRVAAAVTQDNYLLFGALTNNSFGSPPERDLLALHLPTRSWTEWRAAASYPPSGDTDPTTVHLFGAYADQPEQTLAISSLTSFARGWHRVDQCFSPRMSYQAGTGAAVLHAAVAGGVEPGDVTIAGGTNAVAMAWATPIFLPFDGDQFTIQDATVEFFKYVNAGATDLETPEPTDAKPIQVHIRPDTVLMANRGYWIQTDTTLPHAVPLFNVYGRRISSGDGHHDQRLMVAKLAPPDANGLMTLNMPMHGVQLGVTIRQGNDGALSEEGTRVYGIRLGVDGPTITPGFDK